MEDEDVKLIPVEDREIDFGRHFTADEYRCQHCGALPPYSEEYQDHIDFMNTLRRDVGFALTVTSGYRCPEHPIEKAKKKPGAHCWPGATDISLIRMGPAKITKLVKTALAMKGDFPYNVLRGIGLKIHGPREKRFIHFDCRNEPHPVWWTYS